MAFWNIYIWASDMAPPSACVTWHTWTALGCRPNSTCKASGLLPSWRLASSECFESHRVTTIERLDQSHLCPNLEVPGLTCPGQESNPARPPVWEASTLEKNHPDSFSDPLHMSPRQFHSWEIISNENTTFGSVIKISAAPSILILKEQKRTTYWPAIHFLMIFNIPRLQFSFFTQCQKTYKRTKTRSCTKENV